MTVYRVQWHTKKGKLVYCYGLQNEAESIAKAMDGIYGLEYSTMLSFN